MNKRLLLLPFVFLLPFILAWIILFVVDTRKEIMNTNISQYGSLQPDFLGEFKIFPSKIKNEECVKEYFYDYVPEPFDDSHQIYLDCSYSEAEYQAEVQRISEISHVVYDETCFLYPAYIAYLGDNHMSEYALLFEEQNRIVYIYLQFVDLEKIGFPKEYLPYGYRSLGESDHVYAARWLENNDYAVIKENPPTQDDFFFTDYYTTDISHYRQFYHDEELVKSNFAIFPEKLTDEMQVNDYKYMFLNNEIGMKLDCTMTPEKYEQEIERLEDVAEFGETEYGAAYIVNDSKREKEFVLCRADECRLIYVMYER